ncbi:VanZ family protein [Alkalihalobacillus sp. MEB130]|uniref:VanZ family protein n=1 Tax=Alkalihalobacillus sp. MEB130 TaxID=2976704 RepID=UPI0028DF8CA6|nr:VanZ family protein [Alkalihalobacillus sp. MEB130]MDT8860571.1 VanZ family protein [Alkalihalobacillus sp. MEB130]
MRHQKAILSILFLIYIVALFYVTLFAWNYGASLGPAGPGGRNYNVIPFRSIYRIAVFSPQLSDPIRILVGNVILFLPLGFLLPALWRKAQSFVVMLTISFSVSFVIETSQFLFTQRVANVDDLILNTLGGCIGLQLFFFVRWVKRRVVYIHT